MFSELIYRMKFNSLPFYINNFVSYIYIIYIQHLQIHTWNNALPVPSTEAKQRFLVSYPNWTEQGRGDAVDGLEIRPTSWYGKHKTIVYKVLYIPVWLLEFLPSTVCSYVGQSWEKNCTHF